MSFKRLLLFLVGLGVTYNVHAATKLGACIGFLLSMRQNHTLQAISTENTTTALMELGDFLSTISSPSFDSSPSQSPATASNNDSVNSQEAVYRRIRGIIRERFADSDPTESSTPALVSMGSVAIGAEQVESFIQERISAMQLFENIYRTQASDRMITRAALLFNFLVWPAVEIAAGYAAFGAPHSPMGLFLAFSGFPPLLFSIMTDESAIRDVINFDLNQKNRLRAFANRIDINQPGAWVYHSMDVMLDRRNVNFMLQTGEVNPNGIIGLWRGTIYPEKTHNILARIAPILFKKTGDETKLAWIRVDELLRVQEDGNLKLVTLVRVSDNRPRYPVRSRISKIVEELSAALAKPARLPVRGR